MEALQYRKPTNALRALWSVGNAYLVEKEPWKQVFSVPSVLFAKISDDDLEGFRERFGAGETN